MGDGGVGHKPAPNISGQQILRAEQGDADIDADDIAIEPFLRGIESVHKSVLAIDAVFEMIAHGAQRRDGNIGREHQRAAGGARGDGSIHFFKLFDFAIDFVAFGRVGGGDAPDIGPEAERKHFGQIQTIQVVGARGVHRVLEEIDEAAVAAIAEIHPGLRVLMGEQRATADKMVGSVRIEGPLPGIPGVRRNGMRGGTDGQKI